MMKERRTRTSHARKEAPEFGQKVINLRRVARVTRGGKRFNFSVAMIVGDYKGRVGVGTGKAHDTALAMTKATRNAKANIIKVSLTEEKSIAHSVGAKYSSARIFMRPAAGRGLIAGSALRHVLELGGVHNVNGKILSSSKNKLNIARAAIIALGQL